MLSRARQLSSRLPTVDQMLERRRRARLLTACVRGDTAEAGAAAATIQDWPTVIDVAIGHGVLAILHSQLRGVPAVRAEVRHDLAAREIKNRLEQQQVVAGLTQVAGVLDGAGIPWVVVKGPAVAHGLYPEPTLRQAGDLDILVAPSDLAAAIEGLEAVGLEPQDRNWTFIRRIRAGQVHLLLANGIPVDLHWHLFFSQEERDRYPFDTVELLARRRPLRVGDLEAWTLDRTDTLIHLAFHAAREGGDRLGWLVDVDRAVTVDGIDTEALVERCRRWNVGLPVATVLQRAAANMGTDVPTDLLARLAPRGWRAAIAGLDRAFPLAASTRRIGNPAALLAKSAAESGTPGRAVAHAGAGLGVRASAVLRSGRIRRSVRARPANHPNGLLYESGGAAERAAYLAEVAALGD